MKKKPHQGERSGFGPDKRFCPFGYRLSQVDTSEKSITMKNTHNKTTVQPELFRLDS